MHRAVIAALQFIIHSSAKNDVEPAALAQELCQLGVPNEHALAIQRAFGPQRERLRRALASRTLGALPHLVSLDWRVDLIVSASTLATVSYPAVQLHFTVAPDPPLRRIGEKDEAPANIPLKTREYAMELSADKFRVLHHELKALLDSMDSLQMK